MQESTQLPENCSESGVATGELVRWHLAVAYDGTAYHGWQIQSQLKTVQGELLKRLRLMLRAPDLKIFGSSRTDAGVHALDQQVSFEAPLPPGWPPEKMPELLNRWLPDDIVIQHYRICSEPFNARYDNYGKAYTYCISPGVKINPLAARYVWRTPHALDLEAMRTAAAMLVGQQDFASFAVNPGRTLESTVRTLYRLDIIEQDGLVYVNAVGDSFLYKMVRSLVGFLVHVGYGYCPPERTLEILHGCNRSLAADSAPAHGLFLGKVFLRPEAWRDYQPLLPPFSFQSE